MARERRVHHEPSPAPGYVVVLAPEEAHHVTSVLRLRAGDEVSVFDGRGGEWDGALLEVSREAVRVRVGAARTDLVEPALSVVLFQGLCRPDRMEWASEATELGVAAIQPVLLRRVEERAPTPDRLERWRRIAREAAKQSGRRRIPELQECGPPPADPPAGTAAFLLDPCGAVPLGAALAGAPPPHGCSWGPGRARSGRAPPSCGSGWRSRSDRALRTGRQGSWRPRSCSGWGTSGLRFRPAAG